MKKNLLISLAVCLLLIGANVFVARAQAPLSVNGPNAANVVPGVFYIQLKAHHGIDFDHLSPSHTGNADLDNLFANVGVTNISPFDPDAKNYAVARRHGIDRMYVINFSDEGRSPGEIEQIFLSVDVIENVSPRFIFQKYYTPNDPDVSQQYALDKMHIKDAWGISEGNANIIIADVDEGVNYNHEDLGGNIYKIGGLYPGRDMVGKGNASNFIPTNDPTPPNVPGGNHGTMTSGCFGAVADNNIGIAGSGFKCKIMAIKISDSLGQLVAGYEGIQFAAINGAKIINCSWGAANASASAIAFAQIFIDEIHDAGALIVVSSGNSYPGVNIDLSTNHAIPANLRGVFAIGATDQNDQPASFSNYGKSVGAYAPGVGIFSTSFPGNSAYKAEDGTSFSCPLTAGVAGLVWAKNPDWIQKFVMRQIIETCDNVVKPSDRTHYWGRVNAYSALSQQTVPGLEITDFKIDGVDRGGLDYVNKTYSIDVTFKNYMANGSGIQAQLIRVPGTIDPTIPAYSVQQGVASLGAMNSLQQTTGSFQFTRDTNDDQAGGQLPMAFVISYGTSTVQAQKYLDTLLLSVDITGDKIYTISGVFSAHSSMLQLGNTYPNPVTGDGTIDFELASSGYAKLSICDVLGRTVSILSDRISGIGAHQIHFDAHSLENGVYLYKLETSDGTVMTKQMIVLH